MKISYGKTVLAVALLAAAAVAHADDAAVPAVPSEAPHPALRFMMTGGLTFGGDKIADVQYTDGSGDKITAGGDFYVGAGVIWQPVQDVPFSLQATVNYHDSGISASNGSASFHRIPLELMAFYQAAEKVRIGAGVRFVSSPHYSLSVDGGGSDSQNFKSTTGAVVEVDYMPAQNYYFGLRYVSEKYQPKDTYSDWMGNVYQLPKVDGSHVGITGGYIF